MKDDPTYRVNNPQLFSVPWMKSSPRKKSGPSSCSTPVEIFLLTQIKEQKGYSLTLLNNKIKFVLK